MIYQKLYDLRKSMSPIKKDAKGFNYNYFDINTLIHTLQPKLEELNLLILQPLVHVEGKPAIETIVIDLEATDEALTQISFVTPLPIMETKETREITDRDDKSKVIGETVTSGTDPQDAGGVITYYRRYALQSLLLLEAEDDDAASASPRARSKQQAGLPKWVCASSDTNLYKVNKRRDGTGLVFIRESKADSNDKTFYKDESELKDAMADDHAKPNPNFVMPTLDEKPDGAPF